MKRFGLILLSLLFMNFLAAKTITLDEDTVISGIKVREGTEVPLDAKGKPALPELIQLMEETTVQGIQFPEDSELGFDASGRLNYAKPAYAVQIAGIAFQGGSEIALSPTGSILAAILSEETLVQGIKFPADTKLRFDPSGKVILPRKFDLAQDTVFDGITYKGGREILTYSNQKVGFGVLAKTSLIQGLEVPAESEVRYSSTGKLFSINAGAPLKIQGFIFGANSELFFDETGSLEWPDKIEVPSGYSWNNIPLKPKTEAGLTLSGRLKSAVFTQDTALSPLKMNAGTRVNFRKSGQVILPTRMTLLDNTQIDGYKLKKDGTVSFYPSGKLESGVLFENKAVQSVLYMAGTPLFLTEKGQVKNGTLVNSFTHDKISYLAGTEIAFYDSGKVMSGYPASLIQAEKLTFLSNSLVSFSPTGKPVYGTLAAPAKIQGLDLTENTRVTLYDSGKLKEVYPSEDFAIRDCIYMSGSMISFFESGVVNSGKLATDTELYKGVFFKGGTDIKYHPNGMVLSGALASEAELVAGVSFRPVINTVTNGTKVDTIYKTSVTLYSNGMVQNGVIAGQADIGGVSYQGEASFYMSGALKIATLADNLDRNSVTLRAKTQVTYYENGSLESGSLADDVYVTVNKQEIPLKKGRTVTFYPSGTLKTGILFDITKIGKVPYEKWTAIEFFESGQVKRGILAADQLTIEGITFQAGQTIEFNEKGKLNINN